MAARKLRCPNHAYIGKRLRLFTNGCHGKPKCNVFCDNLKMIGSRSRPLPRLTVDSPSNSGTNSATTSTNAEILISPRKLPSISAQESEEIGKNVVNPGENESSDVIKKRKPKRKSSNTRLKPVKITHELLHDLQEDMVDIAGTAPHTNNHPQTTATLQMNQQPIGKFFIEHGRKFKLADEALQLSAGGPEATDSPPKSTALGLSLTVYKNVSTIMLALCGILAGFSLWHCIMVYMLTTSSVAVEDFVQHYSVLAYPAQGMFNFLIAVSTVFLLEKCDIGELGTCLTRELPTFGICSLALVSFTVTLVLHHSVVHIEDALSLRDFNITRFQNDPTLTSSVWTWRNVCLCRCLSAVLGWLLSCKSLRVNRLEKRLQHLMQ